MATRKEVYAEIQACVEACQASSAPYATLSEYIAALKQRPGWNAVAAAQVEDKAIRVLKILKEPIPVHGEK